MGTGSERGRDILAGDSAQQRIGFGLGQRVPRLRPPPPHFDLPVTPPNPSASSLAPLTLRRLFARLFLRFTHSAPPQPLSHSQGVRALLSPGALPPLTCADLLVPTSLPSSHPGARSFLLSHSVALGLTLASDQSIMPDIPKTASVVFDECNGPIRVDNEHKVVQPSELKAGEVLVKLEYTGVCRASSEPRTAVVVAVFLEPAS